jgi:HEAT repeat protein
MSLESSLSDLSDPGKRLSAAQLTSLSGLDEADVSALGGAWPELPLKRRLGLIVELTELAEDNVELNFDAIHKLALQDQDAEVRAAAVRGLYEYEGRDLIGPLALMLRTDPEPLVRREAAIALGRFALVAELGYMRESDLGEIRRALFESAEDLEEDERVRARAIEAAGALSGEETENLIESIYHEESLWLKVGAVDAMGRNCSEVWLPIILSEMADASPEMRHAAAYAAGEIGDETAVQPLKELVLADRDREVQLTAIHSLGEIGGPRARVALQNLLYEGEDYLREAIEEAMEEVAFQDDPLSPL